METTNVKAPVISLKGVCKNFGGLRAVSNVDMDIAQGERRLILGTNGAGKTTVFNMITGELPLSSGTITVLGKVVNNLPTYKRVKLGMRRTYQTSALFNDISVRENLYLALLGCESTAAHLNVFTRARKNKVYSEKIERAAQDFGLADKLNVLAADLSHGERRQLELGTAIITEPKILLFDEPGAGLSANERKMIVSYIQKLSRDITIVMIEHDMELAFAVADYITVMCDGEIVTEGDPETIQNDPVVRKIYLGGADEQ